MIIIYDEIKRLKNIEKHGLDFDSLKLDFFESSKVITGHSGRFRALGLLGDKAISVVFKPLGSEALSVISMRILGTNERKILS